MNELWLYGLFDYLNTCTQGPKNLDNGGTTVDHTYAGGSHGVHLRECLNFLTLCTCRSQKVHQLWFQKYRSQNWMVKSEHQPSVMIMVMYKVNQITVTLASESTTN